MTPLDAMRSALEALDIYEYRGTDTDAEKVTRAITNLRTAIAELESAEPVAWVDVKTALPEIRALKGKK